MNEFIVKKMAEVQAFISLGSTIPDRAGSSFEQSVPEVAEVLRTGKDDLATFIKDPALHDVFTTKVQKTTDKLTRMMELYIGDSWDDPVEVLEWLSFYCGAAAAHAELSASGLATLEMDGEKGDLTEISVRFWELLIAVKAALAENGSLRVKD